MERIGRVGQAALEHRAEARAVGREGEDADATVLGRRAALEQAARLEAVDQAGDVRRVAGQRFGQPPHRHRASRLHHVQHVTLRGREIQVRRERRQLTALRE